MAKHGRVLPARRPREEDDSILFRSAETLGRVIGTLQRQLDGARGRVSTFVLDEEHRHNGNGARRKSKAAPTSVAAKATKVTARKKVASPAKNKATRATAVKRAGKSTTARKRAKR